MKGITPFLWFNDNAEAAARFYSSLFKNSQIGTIRRYGDAGPGPKGSVMTLTFRLEGQEFMALNGGPVYTFSPATSFFVNCATRQETDELWKGLSKGGKVLMELDKYPFSERYGWVQDAFGLSWQLNLGPRPQKITPFLLFVGKEFGKVEEAITFYTSLFKNSRIEKIARAGSGDPDPAGSVKHAVFTLQGQEFMAMESNANHAFTFTPAISHFVNCDTQEEVNFLWEKFTESGRSEQCGWVTDKYGVSWQIIPTALGRLLGDKDPVKAQRVMKAMLKMIKIDITALQKAYDE